MQKWNETKEKKKKKNSKKRYTFEAIPKNIWQKGSNKGKQKKQRWRATTERVAATYAKMEGGWAQTGLGKKKKR